MRTPDDEIRKITHETLIVAGREDRVIPVETSLALMRLVDNAQLHVYPHCGHWTQIERSADFNRLVGDFLSA
jgi:pimeloyl-ACP methyl ester carboxylesterase